MRLRDEASLWQAEAEARARAHGERQGALEERQARLAEREAQLRTARTEVARLAQTLSRLEMRCQEVVLRRTSLEEHVTDRYRDVDWAAWCTTTTCERCSAPRRRSAPPSCAASSNAWARST